MSRRGGCLWLAILLCPLTAQGGDPPAHTEAARQATVQVLAPNLTYYNGVGAPLVYNALSANRPGQFQLASTAGANTVNEPDGWSCSTSSQPPAIKRANIQALGTFASYADSLVTSVTDVSGCNFNHFVSNMAAPDLLTNADRAASLARDWRKQLLTDIMDSAARRKTSHYCDGKTWTEYQRRAYNTTHYLQDAACEHHQVGNAFCNPANVLPQWQDEDQFRFDRTRTCAGWIQDKLARSQSASIHCDVEVVAPTGSLSGSASQLKKYCIDYGIQAVCLGLERLLWHHCDLSGSPPSTGTKSLQCQGPRSDHCGANNANYCEGEVCSGGGQDFIAAAESPTFDEISAAAADWALVCKEPDDPCDWDQCQTWCERSVSTTGSAMVTGYCVNDANNPDAKCDLHQCLCQVAPAGQGCGGDGQPGCKMNPPCTAGQIDARTGRCTTACGKPGQLCCKKYPDCGPGDTAGYSCQSSCTGSMNLCTYMM